MRKILSVLLILLLPSVAFASTGGPRVPLAPSSEAFVATNFDAVSSDDDDDDEIVDLRSQAEKVRRQEIEKQISENSKAGWMWAGLGAVVTIAGVTLSVRGASAMLEDRPGYEGAWYAGGVMVPAGIGLLVYGLSQVATGSQTADVLEAAEDESSAFGAPDVALLPTDGGLFGSVGWTF